MKGICRDGSRIFQKGTETGDLETHLPTVPQIADLRVRLSYKLGQAQNIIIISYSFIHLFAQQVTRAVINM